MPVSKLSIDDVVRRIGEIGIVPVVRASSVEEANRAVEAICAGGIRERRNYHDGAECRVGDPGNRAAAAEKMCSSARER